MTGYRLSPAAAAAEAQRNAGRQSFGAASAPVSNAIDSGSVIAGSGDMFEWFGGGGRAAGMNVTPESAMRTTAVWRCITLIAGAIMALPLGVYERTDAAPIRLTDHEYNRFLQIEPNDQLSAPDFFELQTMAVLQRGNGYARIRKARNGVLHDIDYYHPTRVQPYWSSSERWYSLTNYDGSQEIAHSSDMLHFKGPGLTYDGLRGLNPIQHHAETIGIGMAARDYTARQFEQGLLTNDYFSFEGQVSSDQRAAFIEHLKRRAAGVANAHNPLLMEQGGKWQRLGITAKDAQLLELLQFSTSDIARIFGVPPHMIGDVDKSTSWGTGIEQQGIGFVRYTLLPHLRRFAAEMSRKLFPTSGAKVSKYFIDFDPDVLAVGDAKAQAEFYRSALGGNQLPGFMTINEVRAARGLPPIKGGDEVYIPTGAEPPGQPLVEPENDKTGKKDGTDAPQTA
jgi:HK97 family phage portal protein